MLCVAACKHVAGGRRRLGFSAEPAVWFNKIDAGDTRRLYSGAPADETGIMHLEEYSDAFETDLNMTFADYTFARSETPRNL